ncbi:TRPM8 channel-associated factor homolog [Eucyclogobius newberryi]|uniref:TRPM8 channel-associated factor homolog n=1 Tax=Eucyclogobius newberryi TaxID=166745 RepID=UPI003B5B67C0
MSALETTPAGQQAYASIVRGLKELDLRGSPVPCHLTLTGDHAFPLAVNCKGQVLMAASTYGSGRIVVFGHECYLTMLPKLVENALLWLRGDQTDNMSVGIHSAVKDVANHLANSSLQAKVMSNFSSDQGIAVYVTDAYSVEEKEKDLIEFMKSGGGLLVGGQAWWWASQHPKDNVLLQFGGNKVSGVAGIYFSKDHREGECLGVDSQIPYSWKTVKVCKDFKDDLEFLLLGVSEFNMTGGTFSEVLVHGPLSFPIAANPDGRAVIAGGYYGKGRVIVVSHEGLLGNKTMAPFWNNAVHWLDQGRLGVVGVEANAAFDVLNESGLNCRKTGFAPGLSVFVRTAYGGDHIEQIQEFVAEGGGLLIGGHAWYWAQSHPGQNYLTEFSGNKLLNPMGLTLLSGTVGGGVFKTPEPCSVVKDNYHFRHLLYRFARHVTENKDITPHEEKRLKKLGCDCASFLRLDSDGCCSQLQFVSMLTDLLKTTGMPQVSETCPVKSPKDHLLLSLATEVYKVCPNPEELLGFLIKDNPLLPVVHNQKIKLNVNTADGEEWVSTGLYLSPGMKTYMTIPAEILNKGWKVQVGCQTDHLNANDLKRAPRVCERFPVTSEMMLVHNLWGGLVYLIAPPKTQVTGAEIVVQVGVPAPYYKSGETFLSDWLLLRTAPSPWAELEFENIILTGPSDVVRSLDRPDELAAIWDKIMRAIADLASIPHKFKRKERFVCDVQISHGWMHAGYPIMAHRSAAAEMVSVIHGMTKSVWGHIHELGHNQQRGCWEFPPHTTEATCNLWSVYVHETVFNIPRGKAHPAMLEEKRKERAEKYAKNGRKLNEWDMWTALETYMQLQERFGWDAFKTVFAAYHNMSGVPGNKEGKMNLYCVTFSEVVGMDLTGFFKAWGWPIEGDTEKKLSNLPAWTDHPMAQYN